MVLWLVCILRRVWLRNWCGELVLRQLHPLLSHLLVESPVGSPFPIPPTPIVGGRRAHYIYQFFLQTESLEYYTSRCSATILRSFCNCNCNSGVCTYHWLKTTKSKIMVGLVPFNYWILRNYDYELFCQHVFGGEFINKYSITRFEQ